MDGLLRAFTSQWNETLPTKCLEKKVACMHSGETAKLNLGKKTAVNKKDHLQWSSF